MGASWSNSNSNRNRRRSSYLDHHPPPPPPPYYYSHHHHHPHPHAPPPLMPPPPHPHGYFFTSTNPPPPPQFYSSNGYTAATPNSMMPGRPNHPFYPGPGQGQPDVRPPPYVDHQTAKKIRNDVNLHKHTLRLDIDPINPDHHLISFVFDALFDGRSGQPPFSVFQLPNTLFCIPQLFIFVRSVSLCLLFLCFNIQNNV